MKLDPFAIFGTLVELLVLLFYERTIPYKTGNE
jgi:hypothetical protein